MEKANRLKDKMSLHIDLVDEHPDDEIRAKLTEFEGKDKIGASRKRKQLYLTLFIFSFARTQIQSSLQLKRGKRKPKWAHCSAASGGIGTPMAPRKMI